MIGERLKRERERLGLTQPAMAAAVGTGKTTVINWEKGASSPTASQLAALAVIGVDPLFVVLGQYAGGVEPAPTLTPEEQTLLGYFREASKEVRRAALGALLGAAHEPGPRVQVGGANSQHSTGAGAVNIGSFGSTPTSKRRK